MVALGDLIWCYARSGGRTRGAPQYQWGDGYVINVLGLAFSLYPYVA